MAIFCGGLAQLLAGMWEFPRGNTFGATGEPVFTGTCSEGATFFNRISNGSINTDLLLQHSHPMVHSGCPMLPFSFLAVAFLLHSPMWLNSKAVLAST